jgi:hypothetical protein
MAVNYWRLLTEEIECRIAAEFLFAGCRSRDLGHRFLGSILSASTCLLFLFGSGHAKRIAGLLTVDEYASV